MTDKTNSSASTRFAEIDDCIKQALDFRARKDYEAACCLFDKAIGDLRAMAGKRADVDTVERLVDAYDQGCRTAYIQASLPDNSVIDNWGGKALEWHTQHFFVLEQLMNSRGELSSKDRAELCGILKRLCSSLNNTGNHEHALKFARRMTEILTGGSDPVINVNDYLSSRQLEAAALFNLKREKEALDVVNETLAQVDASKCEQRETLSAIANLCVFKVTLLGAVNRRKMH